MITENFVSDIRAIIEQGQRQAYAAVGQIAVITYWNIGRRIVEEDSMELPVLNMAPSWLKQLQIGCPSNLEQTTVNGDCGIIDSFTWVLMICQIGTRECQISHGLISAALWQYLILMPEGGMLRKPHGKCGASVRLTGTLVRNITEDYVRQKGKVNNCRRQKISTWTTPKNICGRPQRIYKESDGGRFP